MTLRGGKRQVVVRHVIRSFPSPPNGAAAGFGGGGAKTRITFQIIHGGARTFSETRLRDKELWDPGYAGETVASHAGVFRGGMKNEPP